MISASPNSIARSSLEEMLDSLRRRDEAEHSRDLPPALPSRPTSKARLPKRLIQAKLAMEHAVSYDSNKNKKTEVKLVTGGSGRSFVEAAAVGEQRLSENGGATLATSPETEWNHIINHFVKNVKRLNLYRVNSQFKLGVWCKPPQKDLWEFVKIEATMGEEVSVVLSDGSAITISTGEILPANEKHLDDVEDLVELCYLNEPSVLHNLKYRYSRDVIYSKAGNVLLAVNPFKEVKIYGNDFVTAYKDKKSNKPHVYATADAAYRDMMKDGVNQSIIISGVSGSGKTETSKFAMQYLTSVGSQNNNKIKNKLIQANCILEAFGNAKTSKNLNSSRFSRVSRLRRGERSYHIFYQICAGAPPILKDMLSLKMASEYKILNQSGCLKINGVDDADNFIMLVDAFDTFGIPHEVQESVFELVAAILWLGNISFVVIDKEEHVVPKADEGKQNSSTGY
ncbi:putative myosin ATPase [Helianthus annuus]|nr:putative myosin ATPase [Helianthus annuus]